MRTFEALRFLAYLRFELASKRQEALLPLLVPPLLVVFWGSLGILSGRPFENWPTLPFLVGLCLAIGAAASAHAREKDPLTAPFHCLLPVTHEERFATRLLLGLVLPFFGQCFALTLLSNIFVSLGAVILGSGFPGLLLPPLESMLSLGGLFLLAHSVFFAGGIFFRGSPFVKTSLAAVFYAFVLGIASLVLVASGIAERASLSQVVGALLVPQEAGLSKGYETMVLVSRIAWCGVLPLFLYVASALRARELEVRE
ncbi:MAG: hypothetical protein IOD12_15285 [Silvanigrellales bacterium]|nr:hypothetical protein [Silvanigrellales bacterium]